MPSETRHRYSGWSNDVQRVLVSTLIGVTILAAVACARASPAVTAPAAASEAPLPTATAIPSPTPVARAITPTSIGISPTPSAETGAAIPTAPPPSTSGPSTVPTAPPTSTPTPASRLTADQIAATAIAESIGEQCVAAPPKPAKGFVGDPARGKVLFSQRGCAACHGDHAQGDVGPKLAGTTLPFDAVLHQLRQPRGVMQRYLPADQSDADECDVYIYVKGLKS